MRKRSVICGAVRTPIGNFQGGLASVRAPQLGALAIMALVDRTGVDLDRIDEVIMGCVCQAGLSQNPARQAAIFAGVPHSVSAMTINKVCGSGLKAVDLADQAIRAGDRECVVAGGMENMSQIPYALFGARDGLRLGDGKVTDLLVHDGLWDIYNDFHMGMTAEWVVDTYHVSREEQDAYAVRSHQRAVTAWENGKFSAEVVPVEVPQRKGVPVVVARDEGPRADASVEKMASLRPAFKRDGGTVTAGNASSINDGAAAALICNEQGLARLGLEPLARIVLPGTAMVGCEPTLMGYSCVEALNAALQSAGKRVDDLDLIECNEGFAVQLLACERMGKWPRERLNVDGGSVALGHPVGMSGLRISLHLAHALQQRHLKLGGATVPAGSGLGTAVLLERVA
jgi:acetyl-CoA C-acetyltransferase